LTIIVSVIIEKGLGGWMIEIPIVIEEMLDERVLFGGELVNALAAFVVGAFNILKDERQLRTNIIGDFLFHERILFVFCVDFFDSLYDSFLV